jgi:predicted metal-dependent enzyme (double-stranded beta helix superfamily)
MASFAAPALAGRTVDRQSVEPLPLEALVTIATGLGDWVRSRVPRFEPGAARGYERLQATSAYDAWLVAWAASASIDPHDHGGSAGALYVVSGELAESYAEVSQPRPFRMQVLGAGDAIELPTTRIHGVWNPGPHTAISVHVYSPPLSAMTYFSGHEQGSMRAAHTEVADDWASAARV